MSITEKQICEEYRVLKFWKNGLENALYQAHLMRKGASEQKTSLSDMAIKVNEISNEIEKVYRDPIGQAVQRRIESNI